ncbi:TolC family protein [Mariniradius sediminis]|uniref:TolC family protein n=1 Tax=Mariniradius sediminis TaxID=2909237 RepID=A0ABS9BZ79_9BACT|nr:TolC family protein [Mariniradius sediminis]MCF1752183.1 TolC family protein [Mariniradius sediminis]
MKIDHKKLLLSWALFFGFLSQVRAQSQLDLYIQEGLQNNLVLRDKTISLDQSYLALKDAKSFFLPQIDFGANYTLAAGGRAIVIPLGDLLNGVYASLNTLMDQQLFRPLQNVEEQFMPNNFYDARFRVSYPIINPDLHFNKQIKRESVKLQEYEIDIYRAELTKNIKQAYYKYCLASTAVDILKASKVLVEQNLRDNKSLLANGKGLPAQVLRAESEVENINAQLIDAENRMKNAAYYVNFLLNRNLESEVIFEKQLIDTAYLTALTETTDFSNRSEIQQINTAKGIQGTVLKMNQMFAVPRLNTFADFGMQGFDFDYSEKSRYILFGVNMTVPVFQGGRNRNNIQRAQNELERLDYKSDLLDQSIEMALRSSKNNIQAAQAAKNSAETNLRSATSYLRLVDRGYREGTFSLIEFLDARNQFTQSELKLTLADYTLLSAIADLERELETLNK